MNNDSTVTMISSCRISSTSGWSKQKVCYHNFIQLPHYYSRYIVGKPFSSTSYECIHHNILASTHTWILFAVIILCSIPNYTKFYGLIGVNVLQQYLRILEKGHWQEDNTIVQDAHETPTSTHRTNCSKMNCVQIVRLSKMLMRLRSEKKATCVE